MATKKVRCDKGGGG